MSALACRAASPWVAALGNGEGVAFAPAMDHIGRCLHCQARVARTRRRHRDLKAIADLPAEPPTVGGAVDGSSVLRERRSFVIMGAVVVLTAGAVGARRLLAQ